MVHVQPAAERATAAGPREPQQDANVRWHAYVIADRPAAGPERPRVSFGFPRMSARRRGLLKPRLVIRQQREHLVRQA